MIRFLVVALMGAARDGRTASREPERAWAEASAMTPKWLAFALALAACAPVIAGGVHARLAWSAHGGLRVVEAPGSGPEDARLLPDDRIIAIDGTPVRNQTMREVVEALRGPLGTTVELRISRGSQTQTLRVRRSAYRTR